MMQLEEMREQLSLGEFPIEFTSSANISPGQKIPVVIDPVDRGVQLFRWGLVPGWAKDPKIGYKMINARAETVAEKPSFRSAFQHRRCLIPADGFYEWKGEGKDRKPYLFTLTENRPFTFAGLWESWKSPEGAQIATCTLITTEPNELVSMYHDRMPVILGEENRWKWLDKSSSEELLSLLAPLPADQMAEPKPISRLTSSMHTPD